METETEVERVGERERERETERERERQTDRERERQRDRERGRTHKTLILAVTKMSFNEGVNIIEQVTRLSLPRSVSVCLSLSLSHSHPPFLVHTRASFPHFSRVRRGLLLHPELPFLPPPPPSHARARAHTHTQGAEGDYYYILDSGKAGALRWAEGVCVWGVRLPFSLARSPRSEFVPSAGPL